MRSLILGTLALIVLMLPPASRAEVPLFIFAGQSNMVGYRTDVADLSDLQPALQPDVFFYGPNDDGQTWAPIHLAEQPTQITQTVSGHGFGPEASVGEILVNSGRFPRVALVKYAVNGAPNASFIASPADARQGHYAPGIARSWSPSVRGAADGTSLYDGLLQRVREARQAYEKQFGEKTYIAGLFWMQGESDACDPYSASIYAKNFRAFITALRTDLDAPKMPVIFGRIRHSGAFPADQVVRAQQDILVAPSSPDYLPHSRLVDTDSMQLHTQVAPDSGDGSVHYSSRGTWHLGQAMAGAYLGLTRTPQVIKKPLEKE